MVRRNRVCVKGFEQRCHSSAPGPTQGPYSYLLERHTYLLAGLVDGWGEADGESNGGQYYGKRGVKGLRIKCVGWLAIRLVVVRDGSMVVVVVGSRPKRASIGSGRRRSTRI